MIEITTATTLEPLAEACAAMLASAPEDPFSAEWIAVPTGGIRAWLQRQLAARLGATDPARRNGVSMNIRYVRADGLRRALLGVGTDAAVVPDPWSVTAMTWALMTIGSDPDHIERDRQVPLAKWAQRHAAQFARYQIHRPDTIRAWSAGSTAPAPLGQDDQPGLYRAVRAHVGVPDPVERLFALFAGAGAVENDPAEGLPDRISFFGFTAPPDGSLFHRLVAALPESCAVHSYVLDPLPSGPPEHGAPLARSWGRLVVDSRAALGPVTSQNDVSVCHLEPRMPAAADSLLGRLQRRVATGTSDDAPLVAGDRSVVVHGCQGLTRQVEALRDDLLGRFNDDVTLREEDVVVYCADPDRAAPAIRSVLGTPASDEVDDERTPRLRYHIDGVSIRSTDPVADAFVALLELVSGRVTSVDLLTFCQLDAVRRRWNLDDEDIATFRRWTAELNVRWGLDAAHRSRFDIPEGLTLGTWRRALDRLAMGVAYASNDPIVARRDPGDGLGDPASPFGIEGQDVDCLGRLSDLIARVEELAAHAHEALPITERLDSLAAASRALFAPEDDHDDQLDRILQLCSVPVDATASGPDPIDDFTVTLADLRPLLATPLESRRRSTGSIRGGVTVTTPDASRGAPHRLVYLLDLDDSWIPKSAQDQSDLLAHEHRPGDPDRRGEARLSLLVALTTARDALVVLVNTRDVATNKEVPEPITVAELFDALADATGGVETPAAIRRRIVVAHPRQAIDPRCFAPAGSDSPDSARSFDRVAFDAARAELDTARPERVRGATPTARVTDPSPMIALADLQWLLRDSTKYVARSVFDVRLPYEEDTPPERLSTTLDALEAYHLRAEVLDAALAGTDAEALRDRLRAADRLPVAGFGTAAFDVAWTEAERLVDLADKARANRDPHQVTVELDLPGGRRLEGVVEIWRGEDDDALVDVRASNLKNGDRLATFATLIALALAEPSRTWQAHLISKDKKRAVRFTIPAHDIDDDVGDFVAGALERFIAFFDVAHLGPAPLWPEMSKLDGRPLASRRGEWHTAVVRKAAWRFVYGYTELGKLLAQPIHPDDPGDDATASSDGHGSRAEQLSRQLMGLADQAGQFTKAKRRSAK